MPRAAAAAANLRFRARSFSTRDKVEKMIASNANVNLRVVRCGYSDVLINVRISGASAFTDSVSSGGAAGARGSGPGVIERSRAAGGVTVDALEMGVSVPVRRAVGTTVCVEVVEIDEVEGEGEQDRAETGLGSEPLAIGSIFDRGVGVAVLVGDGART